VFCLHPAKTPTSGTVAQPAANREGSTNVAADGRLFCSGGDLAGSTIARVWDKARKAVLTDQEYASVLRRRPYDLRQACLCVDLARCGCSADAGGGVAGQSVAVLHQIYAKVIAGQEASALARIGLALGLTGDESGDRV
jgi:hypothetical protein